MGSTESTGTRDLIDAMAGALNARDFDAVADLVDPDFELRSMLAVTDGDLYVGIEGLRKWAEAIDATWDRHHVELAEVREAGPDTLVVITRNLGVARLSGVPLDTIRGMVVTIRDGRLSRSVVYADAAEAFRAAGIAP